MPYIRWNQKKWNEKIICNFFSFWRLQYFLSYKLYVFILNSLYIIIHLVISLSVFEIIRWECFENVFPWFNAMASISEIYIRYSFIILKFLTFLSHLHYSRSNWTFIRFFFFYSLESMNHVICVKFGVDRDVCVRHRRCCCCSVLCSALCVFVDCICLDKSEKNEEKNRPLSILVLNSNRIEFPTEFFNARHIISFDLQPFFFFCLII